MTQRPYRKNGKTVHCENCNSDIYRYLTQLKRAKKFFCSPKCKKEFEKGKIVDCSVCGKQIYRIPYHLDKSKSGMYFCSKRCSAIKNAAVLDVVKRIINSSGFDPQGYWLGKKRAPFSEDTLKKLSIARTGKKLSEQTKEKLRNRVLPPPKPMTDQNKKKVSLRMRGNKFCLGKTRSEATRLKMSKAHKGENHWNWMGGRSTLRDSIRGSFEYKRWRTKVFLRDNRTCVWCGSKEDIQADHIKPFSLIRKQNKIETLEQAIACNEFWDITNGRTLCLDCHKKTDTYLGKAKKILEENG